VVVNAEVKKEQGRPLFGVKEKCAQKNLTEPTLSEMSGKLTRLPLGYDGA